MDLPIIELAGSPRCMGEAFGESCRAEIRELYALRLEAALRFAQRRGRGLAAAQVLGACRGQPHVGQWVRRKVGAA